MPRGFIKKRPGGSTAALVFLALVAMLAVAVIMSGCQQKQEKAQVSSKQAEGQPGQPPQEMLDALHGKQQPGGPPQGMPPGMGGTPPGMAGMPPGMPAGATPGKPAAPRQVVVPAEVAKTWKGVIIQVVDLQTNKTSEYSVGLGKEVAIPGGTLKLKVESFLPNMKMGPQGITSVSNEPLNPAAKVTISEGGKQPWHGWLFKLYPEMHQYKHPKYRILLKDGQKA